MIYENMPPHIKWRGITFNWDGDAYHAPPSTSKKLHGNVTFLVANLELIAKATLYHGNGREAGALGAGVVVALEAARAELKRNMRAEGARLGLLAKKFDDDGDDL